MVNDGEATIDVSAWPGSHRRHEGIRFHRRVWLTSDPAALPPLGRRIAAVHDSIPVTNPAMTLVDLASVLSTVELAAAIRAADVAGIESHGRARAWIDHVPRSPGAARLRRLLDRHTFRLTDSELERRFLSIASRAGLPLPETGRRVNGFRVDFYWRDLGLVVETDGLRYHRTPEQQSRDRERDQAHAAAGLTCLRFTHAQVRFEPDRVLQVLLRVAERRRHG
jgi:very-short-patch-repair endonuclease